MGGYTTWGMRHTPYQRIINLVRAKIEPERQPRKFLHHVHHNCLLSGDEDYKYLISDSKLQEIVELIVREIRGNPRDLPKKTGMASVSLFSSCKVGGICGLHCRESSITPQYQPHAEATTTISIPEPTFANEDGRREGSAIASIAK
jgi:hypothetical protein